MSTMWRAESLREAKIPWVCVLVGWPRLPFGRRAKRRVSGRRSAPGKDGKIVTSSHPRTPPHAVAVPFEGTIDRSGTRAKTTTPCPWRARTPTAR